MAKITSLTELTDVASDDLLVVVDKSDTSMADSGTDKKVQKVNLLKGLVPENGWIPAGETWTYASATTFRISGDKTSKYQKGDKIKLTQTSVKYFYIIGVSYTSPNTTITVTGGSDYSLTNATITNNFYSRQEAPLGYPAYFNTASGERVTPIGKNIKRTKVVSVSSDGLGGGFATTWTFGTAFTTLLTVSQSGTCTSFEGGQTPAKTMALIDTVRNSSCRVVIQSGDSSVISSGTYYVWAEAFGVI